MQVANPIVDADFTLLKRQLPGAGARGARRYRCDLATLCRIATEEGVSGTIAWVHDLSATGIGLMMPEAVPTDTTLTLRLRQSDQNGHVVLGATVIHCTPEVNDSWRVGCMFERKLTNDEIDSLI